MIKKTNPADCCGCTACISICTHDAISMEPDVLGFLYPKVDESKCVECGLCEKVCQFNDNYDHSLNLLQPIAYAARHKDINEVMKSRSGAAFVAISDYIIEQGGVVYGAGYKDHFRVAHKRATTIEERDEFRGSKYVQSDLTGVFRQVKEDLKNGRTVLFSGTPCQTAGLNAYIGKKLRENLILVDIVCHGVSSPFVLRDYIAHLEMNQKEKIIGIDFRNKALYGWKAHQGTVIFEKSGCKSILNFYKRIMFRHSCGVCHYTNLQRPSDITIADFWGWEKIDENINKDDKGVNLVICNTEKGCKLFYTVSNKMEVITAELSNILQTNLEHPTLIHPLRLVFEKDYKKYGFKFVTNKYGRKSSRFDSLKKKIYNGIIIIKHILNIR